VGLSCFLYGFGSEPPAWLAWGFEAASLRASRRENPTDSARDHSKTRLSTRFVFLHTIGHTIKMALAAGRFGRHQSTSMGQWVCKKRPDLDPTVPPLPKSAGWDPQNTYTLFWTSRGQFVKPGYREDGARLRPI
jgi:hypothetical protein